MPEDHMLKEAIEAVRQGQKVRARDLLTRLLRADQTNPLYWLWLSSVVESKREQAYCLQSVLRLDPQSQTARRGLVLMGAQPPGTQVIPKPIARRNWKVQLLPEPAGGLKAIWSYPVVRISILSVAGLMILAGIAIGVFAMNARPTIVAARPTRTPGVAPTFTDTPTSIPSTLVVAQPTPTFPIAGVTPLWMLLESTYTPTPVYVNTPHAVSEDYRLGQRAFGRGDWETALRHFRNASQIVSDSPDLYYFIGETQRMQEDYRSSLDSYKQSLQISQSFAPAYLGRALASQALDPKTDITQDLDRAIELDPNYVEARLQRVALALRTGDLESAGLDLDAVAELAPDSPMLAYYQARHALQAGEREAALEYARNAYNLDRTLLPAYRLLGEMAVANGEFQLAREILNIYVRYEGEDAEGWLALGQSYLKITGPEQVFDYDAQSVPAKDFEAATEAFERSFELDDELPGVYLYRAFTYMAKDEGQKAVNDLVRARKLDTNSFAINLALGRALLVANRVDNALSQFESCEKLASSDEHWAAIYFWRALAVEADKPASAAVPHWLALLSLPEESVPSNWRQIAEEHLIALTPTATVTPMETVTPNSIKKLTGSPTLTPKPTQTVGGTPDI